MAKTLDASWVLDATYNREYLAGLPDSDGTLDPNFAAAEADLTHLIAGEQWLQAKVAAVADWEGRPSGAHPWRRAARTTQN